MFISEDILRSNNFSHQTSEDNTIVFVKIIFPSCGSVEQLDCILTQKRITNYIIIICYYIHNSSFTNHTAE